MISSSITVTTALPISGELAGSSKYGLSHSELSLGASHELSQMELVETYNVIYNTNSLSYENDVCFARSQCTLNTL